MEETPHLVAHFMAAGAEKRLEDYHFLRNTYETISGQETQLNRILRMLGEDEITLNWRLDLSPAGRARARSPYDFDRWANSLVLKGSIAYERLREIEQDTSKNTKPVTIPSSSRRVQEIRERRQRLSEQRDYPSDSTIGASATPSSSRLRVLAEYETALAESDAKRQRLAEENRLSNLKNKEQEVPERKREIFKTKFTAAAATAADDDDKSYAKSKQREDESSDRSTRKISFHEDQDKKIRKDQENDSDKIRKSSIEYQPEKSGDIELISFTVRCQTIPSSSDDEDDNNSSIRLLCQWASPSSSSAIKYFTIERQLGDNDWIPIGEKIDRSDNQTQLDIPSSNENNNNNNNEEINTNIPSYFRLKAHLQNGQTFTSKPTDGIFINLSQEKNIIIPDVEILSSSSVQLTWKDNEKEDKKNENDENEDKKNENEENEENSNIYDIEKKEEQQLEWEKVTEVPLSQRSARIDSLTDAKQCQFRLIPTSVESEEITKPSRINSVISSKEQVESDEPETPGTLNTFISSEDQDEIEESAIPENEVESEEISEPQNEAETDVFTVNNVNEWLSSLHVVPTSSNTVDVDISKEGFKTFDSYKVEYTTADRPDKWKQVSADITSDDPHLTIDNLKQGTDYKFRFTPITSDTIDETNSSQLSLVLDVKMPSARKGRFTKDESETPVTTTPQFSIQKLDPSTVLIEAVVPEDEPATFEDVYDVYSKKDIKNNDDEEEENDDWTKVGTIDKEHLSTTVENLEENTAYAFKIDNITSPLADDEDNTVQEFKFDTTPVKQYDPSLFLEKIEQSLETVVNGVMQAAAGHQTLEEPVNKSLNEVIKEVFRDENLIPNEEYGFDTLALNNDLQIYRGPKQMMLKDLEIDETMNSSIHYGEIIIHNYRSSQQSVIVRAENGNTRVANIDGDIIIRNVVSDVTLKNEQTHHQLSMNIVGQAFLKGVQGTLIASKFKGIIVVKNVNKP